MPSGKLWAKCNLGGETATSCGLFFSWANVEGHAVDSGYPFDSASYEQTPGHELETNITPDYDAALSMLGDGWHIPGTSEYMELTHNCDYSMDEIGGVMCCVFTSRINGRMLIFPACGLFRDSTHLYDGSIMCVWTVQVSDSSNAYCFRASEDTAAGYTVLPRRTGMPIRAVRDP